MCIFHNFIRSALIIMGQTKLGIFSTNLAFDLNLTKRHLFLIKQPCMATVSKLSDEMSAHYDDHVLFVSKKGHYFIKRTT